jgi:polysaccharide deacetylase 2 family uncharacterized protein YibQ
MTSGRSQASTGEILRRNVRSAKGALRCAQDDNVPARRLGFVLLSSAVLALIFAGGCGKKEPDTKELRAITHELVAASQKVAGRKSEIAIRPEMGTSEGGQRSHLIADNIYITLADSAQKTALEQALEDVARRYHLARTGNSSAGGVLRFDYELDGRRTHTIHIVTPVAARPGQPQTPTSPGGSARLAIIIDDLGYDGSAVDAVLALPVPLTVAVLPHHSRSSEIAEEAHRRGDQVILHLPMQSASDGEENGAAAESVELRVGMTPQEVEQALDGMLETVPHAAGANNHQGSRATADPGLMDAVMRALARRGMFFIDSRTTVQTVAYDTAERDGVRAAFRKVFLDDTPTREAILRQLELAARDAKRLGWAIAIGHPHPATIAALGEGLPRLEASGIRLVFASDLAH